MHSHLHQQRHGQSKKNPKSKITKTHQMYQLRWDNQQKQTGHKENIDAVVTQLHPANMFLGYDWLTKHNPTINWENGTIKFTRCPLECKTRHHDISLLTHLRRLKTKTEDLDQEMKQTKPTLKTYLITFNHSPIWSTKRTLINY
jgi:hypothetical protein